MDNQQPSIKSEIVNQLPLSGKGFIYCYTSPSGKKYIGQTIQSLSACAGTGGRGYKHCPLFWKAIQKYGIENFKVEILEEVRSDKLDEREKFWIENLNSYKPKGYNLTTGEDGYSKIVYQYSLDGHFLHSFNSLLEAAKNVNGHVQNISDCLNDNKKTRTAYGFRWSYEKKDFYDFWGFYYNNEPKKIYSYSLEGDFIKEYPSITAAAKEVGANRCDIKKAISGTIRWCKGFQWSIEKKEKMPAIRTGKNGSVKVKQYDLDGNLIAIFESQSEASKKTGSSATGIQKCCQKKQKSCNGFHWEIYEGSTTTIS